MWFRYGLSCRLDLLNHRLKYKSCSAFCIHHLNNLLSLKPNETRMASLTIGVMLLTSVGAALGGTGIEALFFARFGVEYLPYMFVGLGITSMIMSFGMTALLSRVPKQILYVAIPLLVSVVLVLARFALLSNSNWLYPALWLGKEVLNILIGLVIWGIAGVVCDTRQAKRLFPLFNASRILGQVIGGFVTGLLVASIGTENLLIVWAGALILSFILSRALLAGKKVDTPPQKKSRRKQPTLIQEMQRGYQYVRGSSLMTWISISTIFFLHSLFLHLASVFPCRHRTICKRRCARILPRSLQWSQHCRRISCIAFSCQ